MTEHWKTIPFAPNYQASDLGRIRSLSASGKNRKRVLRPCRNGKGRYFAVSLCIGRRIINRRVHCLVLAAFVGPRPKAHHGAHLNGDKDDSRLVNLAWITAKENAAHKHHHGTVPFRLTIAQVRTAHRLRESGWSLRAIGRHFGTRNQTIKRNLARVA